MDLTRTLQEKRPNLGSNSIKTYTSVLKSLHKKVYGDDTTIELDNFTKEEKILASLKDKSPTSRKTTLSALVVLTNNDTYRQEMLNNIKAHQEIMDTQVMSEKQVENSVSQEDIKKKLSQLKSHATKLMKKEAETLTKQDYQSIQNYIMLYVMSGQGGLPPRRSLDYTEFRIAGNIDKLKHNYMDKKHFVFNTFKTAKSAGQQKISIPIRTRNLIRRWIQINPTEYLFFDSQQKPMTSVKMTQKLNKIFDKNVSVNALRSSYLSNRFQDSIQIKKDIENTMKQMGSSSNVATTYIKEKPMK